MPGVATKNPLADKLDRMNVGKVIDAHKNEEVDYGFGGEMPAGVNGIARLSAAKVDAYKKGENTGELFLYLAGICEQAQTGFEMCVGNRTSLTLPLCATKGATADKNKTAEENQFDALTEIAKLLGIKTVGELNVRTGRDIANYCEALVKAKMRFKFSTSAGKVTPQYKVPRIFHNWSGLVKSSPTAPATNGQAQSAGVQDNTAAMQTPISGDGEDWTAIGEAAVNDDTDAQVKITEAAEKYGVAAQVNDAKSWSDAAALVAQAAGGGAAPAAEAPEGDDATEWKPEKGKLVTLKPPKAKNECECEITAVFSETVTLRRTKDNFTFKGVPWSADPPSINGQAVE